VPKRLNVSSKFFRRLVTPESPYWKPIYNRHDVFLHLRHVVVLILLLIVRHQPYGKSGPMQHLQKSICRREKTTRRRVVKTERTWISFTHDTVGI